MDDNYYSLDSVCSQETFIPAVLLHGCSGVGTVIDPSSDVADLPPGTRLELPLWMAADLAKRNLVLPQLPIVYGDKMRRKIKAGAGCEDLKARAPYFYSVAEQLHAVMSLAESADETLPAFVATTLRGRYKELLTRAPQVENSVESSHIQSKLSVEEASLFVMAAEAATAHDGWRCNKEPSKTSMQRAGSMKRKWGQAAP